MSADIGLDPATFIQHFVECDVQAFQLLRVGPQFFNKITLILRLDIYTSHDRLCRLRGLHQVGNLVLNAVIVLLKAVRIEPVEDSATL